MRLLEIRKSLNLSQNEVAAALGIPQTTYSGYETGNRKPSPDILCKMADYFNISIDVLLERTPQLFDDARTEIPEIISIMDKLTPSQQSAIIEYARFLASSKQ